MGNFLNKSPWHFPLVPFWCLRNGDIWSLVTAASIRASHAVLTWKQCPKVPLALHFHSGMSVELIAKTGFTGNTKIIKQA